MFAQTENPSDSKISQNYLKRVHETANILSQMAHAIHLYDLEQSNLNEMKNKSRSSKQIVQKGSMKSKKKTNDIFNLIKRMKNLIGLINAEKFNFEDLDAWRMGSLMDRRFRDHWKIRSDELNSLRINCKQQIDAGQIISVANLREKIDLNQNKIIDEEKTLIDSIKEAELEAYYKTKLLDQLRDQIENYSRRMKYTLERDLERHCHKIANETGKFSQNVLEKKILDTIEKMNALSDQYIDDRQLNLMFQTFWESEDAIGGPEIKQLKDNNAKAYAEQKVYYRLYIKQGFEAAFDSERYDVAVKQEFNKYQELENWKFTEKDLLAINVMNDKEYFHEPSRLSKRYWKESWINHHIPSFLSKSPTYDLCMSQILDRFKELIQGNPYTEKGYDGDVDFTKIRDLCIQFAISIKKVTDDYDITQYVKPIFTVRCIAFASQMLRKRIDENSALSELKNDPVHQFNKKKNFYLKLFKMKLLGAQRSQIWQQQLHEFFKEALIHLYLNLNESYATHEVIDKFIRECSGKSERKSRIILPLQTYDLTYTFCVVSIIQLIKSFPSLETYRRFRFCLYMNILEDSKIMTKSDAWEKWHEISNYDMRPREKQFLS